MCWRNYVVNTCLDATLIVLNVLKKTHVELWWMENNDLIAERRKLITTEAKNAHILSEQFYHPSSIGHKISLPPV